MAKARTDREQGYDVYMGRTSDPAPSPHRAMNSGNREPQLSPYNTDPESRTDGGTYYIPTDEELHGRIPLTPDERRVIDALRSIRYGSVTVEIQDGRLRLLRKGETEKLGDAV